MIRGARSELRSRASIWRRRLFQALSLVATLTASSAFADTVIWIGRPTVHDYMAYSARQALEQYQQLHQQIAVFNGQIADARRAYFLASPASRAAAGDKFGELLLQKDLLIAMPSVIGGDGDSGKVVSALMRLANGGDLPDGGIPPSARSAFGQWVAALQLRSGGVFGRVPDPVRASQVLLEGSTLTEYEKYRRLRDQAEFDEFEAGRNGGVRRLVDHGSVPARALIRETDAIGFDTRIRSLDDRVLRCTYAGTTQTEHWFWQGQPPQDIMSLLAMNSDVHNGLLDAVQDHAADECPADSKLASALDATPLKEPLTPQMRMVGRAQAHSLPATPEQLARQAEARERIKNRAANETARGEANAACRSEFQAALQTHDRAVMQAARKPYADCMADVRRNYPF